MVFSFTCSESDVYFLSCQPLIEPELPSTDVTARHAQSYWSEQCFWCKGRRICKSWRSGIHSSDKVSCMNILISSLFIASKCIVELVFISFCIAYDVLSMSDCKTVNLLFIGKLWFSKFQVLQIHCTWQWTVDKFCLNKNI